ncbi:MAG: hypothetical protein LBK57_03735 [Clostridiales Family XIII bacterium]|jgi:hypothetical protein|nr:hypothetical protein [Clostridiales Family XIII bacterium]
MGKRKKVFEYDENVTLAETLDEIRESAQSIPKAEAALAALLEYAIKQEEKTVETKKTADV